MSRTPAFLNPDDEITRIALFQHDPTTLTDSRLQLHWATQLLSAAADATLDHREDDSHSNLQWDSQKRRMVNRAGTGIDLDAFGLFTPSRSVLGLNRQTLETARLWLEQELGTPIALREYEMPEHPVSTSARFQIPQADLDAIAVWYAFGLQAMSPFGTCRIWPHHLDLGWLREIDGPDHSIGGGLSPGDVFIDEPYFYVNPYGIDRMSRLPPLASGFWSEHFFGAVLTASEIRRAESAEQTTRKFLREAVEIQTAWFPKGW